MDSADTTRTMLRREVDGRVIIDPKVWGPRIALAAAALGLIVTVATIVGGQIVRPPALEAVKKAVTDSVRIVRQQGEQTTASVVRLNVRVDSLAEHTRQMQQALEVIAIDVCLRNRNNPLARLRLSCGRLLP